MAAADADTSLPLPSLFATQREVDGYAEHGGYEATARFLREHGVSADLVLRSGIDPSTLANVYSVRELHDAGLSVMDLISMGVPARDVLEVSSVDELMAIGYAPEDLA